MIPLTRRHFLRLTAGAALIGSGGCGPLSNPCVNNPMPAALARHRLVTAAWQGLDPTQMWDVHVHLAGVGDDPTGGIWIHPDMTSPWHLRRFLTMKFLLNASCVNPAKVDTTYVAKMLAWMDDFPLGAKLALLAFDHFYTPDGEQVRENGVFHVPNATAARWAGEFPHRFVWIASIHPYRKDAVPALEQAVKMGARAVKWLPQAMGMDPGSPLCDDFYQAMTRMGVPLLCHVGRESTVPGEGEEAWANPLRLRRPLEKGVTVIAAHCASDGLARDLDQGEEGPEVTAFDLFCRLLEEAGPKGNLYGDISATVLLNRAPEVAQRLLEHPAWHARLLYGSDHPLPGVIPITRLGRHRRAGLLTEEQEELLSLVQAFNPLMFNFLLMRFLSSGGRRYANQVFQTRRVLDTARL